MSLFDEVLYQPGGNVKGERFAEGEKITKDWLYTYRDRDRQIKVLRELLADLSEKRFLAPTARFDDVGKGKVLPRGLDELVGRFDALQERYVRELNELLRKQELVEKWMGTLTPRQKELVRLRFLLGYSLLKTAEILGKSTVYVAMHEKKIFS